MMIGIYFSALKLALLNLPCKYKKPRKPFGSGAYVDPFGFNKNPLLLFALRLSLTRLTKSYGLRYAPVK